MKANLNLFLDLMTMPDNLHYRSENLSVLNSYIWSNGKLSITSNQPEDGSELIWNTRQFPLGSKGKVKMVQIHNGSTTYQDVKVFFESRKTQQFQQVGYVSPKNDCIFIHNENDIQLVNGTINGGRMKQCAVFPVFDLKQKIRSGMKKGRLHYQPFAKGNISSMFSLECSIPPGETITAWGWTVQGKHNEEVLCWNNEIRKNALAMS
ncbi:hypothetical protein GCM10008967_40120 [Bacillus carboniphilus]|uniref:Uncharacterized protein n=1 Tax=Bacillus carboniphilus TaxID=86663 RepID=A0ABN0WSK3_9BACI